MSLRIVYVLMSVLLALPQAVAQEQQWEEGTHYKRLASEVQTRSGDRIEVAEVFWYGCPHCYEMQPLINQWKKRAADDVNLRHVPASLRSSWESHARAFYVARELGVLDTVHPKMFEALAEGNRKLKARKAVAEFFDEIGAAEAKAVREAWDSFAVDTAMRRGRSFQKGARVTGTPTLVVEGRYVITARKAGSYENMLAIADYLVEKERSGE